MTRKQKFAWALGYFALSVLATLAYLFVGNNVLLVLPGTSIFTGWVIAAFSDIHFFRRSVQEDAEKSAVPPCKSSAGDV